MLQARNELQQFDKFSALLPTGAMSTVELRDPTSPEDELDFFRDTAFAGTYLRPILAAMPRTCRPLRVLTLSEIPRGMVLSRLEAPSDAGGKMRGKSARIIVGTTRTRRRPSETSGTQSLVRQARQARYCTSRSRRRLPIR